MMSRHLPTNREIADVLDRIADLLEAQDANPFRVHAYRNGADHVRTVLPSIGKQCGWVRRERTDR